MPLMGRLSFGTHNQITADIRFVSPTSAEVVSMASSVVSATRTVDLSEAGMYGVPSSSRNQRYKSLDGEYSCVGVWV